MFGTVTVCIGTVNTLAWPTLYLHLTAATLKQRHYKTSDSPVILIMLPSNPLSSADGSQCGVCARHLHARDTVEQGVVPNAIIPVLHGRSPEVQQCWTQARSTPGGERQVLWGSRRAWCE